MGEEFGRIYCELLMIVGLVVEVEGKLLHSSELLVERFSDCASNYLCSLYVPLLGLLLRRLTRRDKTLREVV